MDDTPDHGMDGRVDALRRFNRFYTRLIGILREGHLESPYSLTEARVLYEVKHRRIATAADLARDLSLDPGYLSRLLRGLSRDGLITRAPSPEDGRQSLISLSDTGHTAFDDLERRQQAEVAALLQPLAVPDQERLIAALTAAESLLSPAAADGMTLVLRPHRPGDLGWIIHRHAVLYTQDYGWDARFEGMVATIAAAFLNDHDSRRERCWIAEKDGEMVGSVMVVRHDDATAKLRLLLVEPRARGLGIGRRLLEESLRFARQAGYARMTLWTNSILTDARRLYEQAGFRLVSEDPHTRFGPPLIGQTWERDLA